MVGGLVRESPQNHLLKVCEICYSKQKNKIKIKTKKEISQKALASFFKTLGFTQTGPAKLAGPPLTSPPVGLGKPDKLSFAYQLFTLVRLSTP
jgi:hypothetical protein